MSRLLLILVGFLQFAVGLCSLDALTIYRIGGEDLPLPELASEEGVQFKSIAWSDVDGDLHGSTNLMEVGAGRIAPRQLDPSVNLTPLLPKSEFLGESCTLPGSVGVGSMTTTNSSGTKIRTRPI